MNLTPQIYKIKRVEQMPDVNNESLNKVYGTLNKAGMEKIELPVNINNGGGLM